MWPEGFDPEKLERGGVYITLPDGTQHRLEGVQVLTFPIPLKVRLRNWWRRKRLALRWWKRRARFRFCYNLYHNPRYARIFRRWR